MHAVDPLVKDKLEPSEQELHTVNPLIAEKEPGEQGVHTQSDVVVQGVCWYVPAGHGAEEQGIHAVAPLVVENEVPAIHDLHTLSVVHVHAVCTY